VCCEYSFPNTSSSPNGPKRQPLQLLAHVNGHAGLRVIGANAGRAHVPSSLSSFKQGGHAWASLTLCASFRVVPAIVGWNPGAPHKNRVERPTNSIHTTLGDA
jgi:hypothetical protein